MGGKILQDNFKNGAKQDPTYLSGAAHLPDKRILDCRHMYTYKRSVGIERRGITFDTGPTYR